MFLKHWSFHSWRIPLKIPRSKVKGEQWKETGTEHRTWQAEPTEQFDGSLWSAEKGKQFTDRSIEKQQRKRERIYFLAQNLETHRQNLKGSGDTNQQLGTHFYTFLYLLSQSSWSQWASRTLAVGGAWEEVEGRKGISLRPIQGAEEEEGVAVEAGLELKRMVVVRLVLWEDRV